MLERLTRGVKILLVAHFVGWLLTPLLGPSFQAALLLDPSAITGGFELWRLFTFPFVVAGVSDLLFTALGLIFFASTVERRLGTRAFIGLYFAASVTAGILLVALSFAVDNPGLLAGATAAQFAILAAFTRMSPNGQVMAAFVLPVKAIHLLWFVVALQFMRMWDVQRIVWPMMAELAGVGVGWVLAGGFHWDDLNPVERFKNWRYRQRMQKFAVIRGGKKADPSQYLH